MKEFTIFSEKQYKELNKPLDPKNIEKLEHGSKAQYVTGWHVVNEANRIFGFDKWSCETVYCREVCRSEVKIGKQQQNGFKVGYEAKVRIDVDGVVKEGTGFGSGVAKDLCDCIEGAAKEAETDAMKRAFRLFGNQFGLALYDKKKKAVQSIDAYDKEMGKIEILEDTVTKKLKKSKSIKELTTNWTTQAQDIATIKLSNRAKYDDILETYKNLKKDLG